MTHVDSELAPLGEPARIQINNMIIGAQVAAVADSQGQRIGTMIVLRDVIQNLVVLVRPFYFCNLLKYA